MKRPLKIHIRLTVSKGTALALAGRYCGQCYGLGHTVPLSLARPERLCGCVRRRIRKLYADPEIFAYARWQAIERMGGPRCTQLGSSLRHWENV